MNTNNKKTFLSTTIGIAFHEAAFAPIMKMDIVFRIFINRLEMMIAKRFAADCFDVKYDVTYYDSRRVIDIEVYDNETTCEFAGTCSIIITPDYMTKSCSANEIFEDFEKDLYNFIEDTQFIYYEEPKFLWKTSMNDIYIEYQKHVLRRLETESLSIEDFGKLCYQTEFSDHKTIYVIEPLLGSDDKTYIKGLVKASLRRRDCKYLEIMWKVIEENEIFCIDEENKIRGLTIAVTDFDEKVEADGFKIVSIGW